ncbi:MAG: ligand-binding protein SH3 [Candidatus Aquicultor secundus]|uniref:Ligand-binding protein SH3 n=1 Tax=Candidatus Aquicultor secundus TaxID=1973895 RepID=A0A2M7T8L9_9ACTN|nr:small multi-drug export protein [Candidatus Aquicultor secundus]NCO65908.1 small multi-drug export protein [Solirubrobacter sp.]OIO87636.1 MAG: hypothetical protein AUK32_03375 [Candidatus Aquicultor secundus]PIU27612.1 MAG: ligand-binding protein SH3 [Candidatus Aquicultor secundus]PIW21245.1 MAG: ligand-binding protein SH3 [Candidatus Aquicultor secundus]PIX51617.1 MAG: ligand-binding protein SH3 [Candidatus Aquicultor secundus]
MIGADIISRIPKEIIILIISALPIVERTGAPLAIATYHMPIWEAFVISSIGMMLPVIPLLLLLDPVSRWLAKKSRIMDQLMGWFFEHTRRKHSEKIDRYGAVGLFLFVAVPLPGTGSWSGALLAYLFNIDFKYSMPSMLLGAIAAGFLASIATASAVAIAKIVGGLFVGIFLLAGIGAYIAGKAYKKRGRGSSRD